MSQPLEEIARPTIEGLIEEIHAYTHRVNDGSLAPWMMAELRAKALLRDIQETARDIGMRSPEPAPQPVDREEMKTLERQVWDRIIGQVWAC